MVNDPSRFSIVNISDNRIESSSYTYENILYMNFSFKSGQMPEEIASFSFELHDDDYPDIPTVINATLEPVPEFEIIDLSYSYDCVNCIENDEGEIISNVKFTFTIQPDRSDLINEIKYCLSHVQWEGVCDSAEKRFEIIDKNTIEFINGIWFGGDGTRDKVTEMRYDFWLETEHGESESFTVFVQRGNAD